MRILSFVFLVSSATRHKHAFRFRARRDTRSAAEGAPLRAQRNSLSRGSPGALLRDIGTFVVFFVIELTGIFVWRFGVWRKTALVFDIVPVFLVPWTLSLIILSFDVLS